ncbi:CPBP family intramembrane glutamic endopeptidase [Rhodococcus spelaei]|uniref:CPBP family intramembrane glutamic endopeptidase n=1 Tax=Rhodococcus spelaei TaxID=2546320 RepID=UPI0015EFD45D|nr:CPBP family intramembrane glutamic endopeptidase [Rhodococcus spelaei]
MRVTPRPWIGIGVVLAYVVLGFLTKPFFHVDYTTIADSTDNLLNGIVYPIGVGAVFAALLTTWFGWWRPAMTEARRCTRRWAILPPALLLLTAVVSLTGTDFGPMSGGYLLTLAVGVLIVGFTEELICRGLAVVGYRGGLGEVWVWLLSSAAFGLMHATNALDGQSGRDTALQVAATFVIGTTLYMVRRITGSLVWAMLLHAVWDFSSLASEHTSSSTAGLSGVLVAATVLSTLLLVRLTIRDYRPHAAPVTV